MPCSIVSMYVVYGVVVITVSSGLEASRSENYHDKASLRATQRPHLRRLAVPPVALLLRAVSLRRF